MPSNRDNSILYRISRSFTAIVLICSITSCQSLNDPGGLVVPELGPITYASGAVPDSLMQEGWDQGLRDALKQAFVDADARHAMFFRPGEGDRSMFDLKGLVLEQLLDAGVGRLEMLPYDTCADEDLFFSNRRRTKRGEERFGLQLSVIGRAHSPT